MSSESGRSSGLQHLLDAGASISKDLLAAALADVSRKPVVYSVTTLIAILSIYYVASTVIKENYRREVCVLRVSRLDGGTYQEILNNIEGLLRDNYHSSGLSMQWTELKSGGAVETANEIAAGKADIGIVQEDTDLPSGEGIRSLAIFNEEPFLWFTLEPVKSLADLKSNLPANLKLTVATGKNGSMTLVDFGKVLRYYRLDNRVTTEPVGYDEAFVELSNHTISNAFFVAGPFTQKILRIESVPDCRLLNIDQTITNQNPTSWRSQVYGPGTFGADLPQAPLQTVKTRAVLVARSGLSKGVVRELLQLISDNQQVLENHLPYLNQMQIPPESCGIPMHPGVLELHGRPRLLMYICSAVLLVLLFILVFDALAVINKNKGKYYEQFRRTIQDLEPADD